MRYRTLGERGPAVSAVGVGGNNFGSRLDEEGTKAVVHAALDAGNEDDGSAGSAIDDIHGVWPVRKDGPYARTL